MKVIADAAHRGESVEILVASERLQKVEALIARYEKLLRDISDLDEDGTNSPETDDVSQEFVPAKKKEPHNMNAATGRDIGTTERTGFLKKLSESGIDLLHIRGTIYETHSGHKVGIAVATERQPDRWFLGLPYNGFDHAVLLCKPDRGETVNICLPQSFFKEYGADMSQSGGQIKFNVTRRGNGFAITVPGRDSVSVSRFIGAYSPLQ
jgi:hypothetical protein